MIFLQILNFLTLLKVFYNTSNKLQYIIFLAMEWNKKENNEKKNKKVISEIREISEYIKLVNENDE